MSSDCGGRPGKRSRGRDHRLHRRRRAAFLLRQRLAQPRLAEFERAAASAASVTPSL